MSLVRVVRLVSLSRGVYTAVEKPPFSCNRDLCKKTHETNDTHKVQVRGGAIW